MKHSDQINELAQAMAKSQGEFKEIKKTKTAIVRGETKTGKAYEYSYDYADLSVILQAVTPALAKNGLFLTQGTNAERSMLITKIIHSSGQWIETEYPIISKGQDMQGEGAGFTFARRYAINGILGISSEADTDGEHQRPSDNIERKPQKLKEPAKEIKNYAPAPANDNDKLGSDGATRLIQAVTKAGIWSIDEINGYIKTKLKSEIQDITWKQGKEFLELANKKAFIDLVNG